MKHKIELIIIHCTATKEGQELDDAWIRKVHLSPPPMGRGWKQVGYRDMIQVSGNIINLVKYNDDSYVDPWEITNGVAGINYKAGHIVYVGGLDKKLKPKDTRTSEQLNSMEVQIKKYLSLWPWVKIAGHYQFDNKACPCFDVPTWLRSIGVKEENIYIKP